MVFDELSHKVIGCCIEVHKFPGPGLLENAYKNCLASELQEIGIKYKIEYELPVIYKEMLSLSLNTLILSVLQKVRRK